MYSIKFSMNCVDFASVLIRRTLITSWWFFIGNISQPNCLEKLWKPPKWFLTNRCTPCWLVQQIHYHWTFRTKLKGFSSHWSFFRDLFQFLSYCLYVRLCYLLCLFLSTVSFCVFEERKLFISESVNSRENSHRTLIVSAFQPAFCFVITCSAVSRPLLALFLSRLEHKLQLMALIIFSFSKLFGVGYWCFFQVKFLR